MKSDNPTNPFYTTVLATLLKEWREKNLVTVYAVAKAINTSPHTITRFEQFQGGVSLEVGLRYLEFAETHVSHPDIFRKFRTAIVYYKTEEEQQLYVTELKQRNHDVRQKEEEKRRQREERIRKSVVDELQKEHNSKIHLLNDEYQKLVDKITQLEHENAVLKNENSTLASENVSNDTWFSRFKRRHS